MIKNYFKIAWRNLIKNKIYSAINILGLSIGVSTCLAIFLIINFELSFDNFWKNKDSLYKLTSVFEYPDGTSYNEGLSAPVPAAVQKEIPELSKMTAFHVFWTNVKIPDIGGIEKKFPEPNWPEKKPDIILAQPSYFDLFSYDWVIGSAQESLKNPNTVVITESKLQQYFGNVSPESVIGKTIIYSDSLQTTVTGIVKDLPINTDMNIRDFISFSSLEGQSWKSIFQLEQWTNTNSSSQAFVELDANVDINKLNKKIADLVIQKIGSEDKWGKYRKFKLQPLTNMHFNTDVELMLGRVVNMKSLYILILIAFFILILAAINFINLTTAQSFSRAKEIGVRKILGGFNSSLMVQFLTETFVLTSISVLIAIAIIKPAFILFSDFIPSNMKFEIFDPKIIGFIILMIVVTTFLSGLYPAFLVSRLNPSNILKSKVKMGAGNNLFGNSLIVFQFAIAQIFILGTFVMFMQTKYLLNKDVGLKKDHLVYFDLNWNLQPKKKTILAEKLRALSTVDQVSLSDIAARSGFSTNKLKFKEKEINVHQKSVDENFIDVYGIKMIAGRALMKSDTPKEVVVNEAFTLAYGYAKPEDAVGELLDWWDTNNQPMKIPIVGVMKDFNFQSLHNPINPLMIRTEPNYASNIAISLKDQIYQPAEMKLFSNKVNQIYKEVFPETEMPVELKYFDQNFKSFYTSENKMAKLLNMVTFIAILISCLGLLGLTAHAIQRKTKEIGIRKVLGASLANIAMLLSKDFIKLVAISIVIACPIAYYFIQAWLQNFAFSIEISLWVFVVGALVAMLIAISTVSIQSINAARKNPTESLKSE